MAARARDDGAPRASGPDVTRDRRDSLAWLEAARRALGEFLGLPTAIIVGFLLLAAATYALDRAGLTSFALLGRVRAAMQHFVFGSPDSTSSLLGSIAAGLITVTSITLSILLLALQQSAASMTSQVFDQFLRR